MRTNLTKPPIEERDGAILLRVRVQPRASRNAFRRDSEGGIQVALTAPPVDDAANRALCVFVADQLGVPKRSVQLSSGGRSRNKVLSIRDISVERVLEILSS